MGQGQVIRWRYPSKTHPGEIEFADEHIDYTDRIILGHVLVQMFGQQRALSAVLAPIKRFISQP